MIITKQRRAVLTTLRKHGPIVDKDGLATARLRNLAGYTGGSTSFTSLLRHMEQDGLIFREKDDTDRRTLRIGMANQRDITSPQQPAETTSASQPPTPLTNTTVEDSALRPVTEPIDYPRLAAELLNETARVLQGRRIGDSELASFKSALNISEELNTRLRTKLGNVESEAKQLRLALEVERKNVRELKGRFANGVIDLHDLPSGDQDAIKELVAWTKLQHQ